MISSILRLLVLALELWVQRESRREQIDLLNDEREIQKLRNMGDPASQLAADRVRQRIARGGGILSRVSALPAPGPAAGEGAANTNS